MSAPRFRLGVRCGARAGLSASLLCAVLMGCAVLVGCAAEDNGEEAVARGRELVRGKGLSPSTLNLYSCATCHDEKPSKRGLLRTGAPLAGATLRTSFWGGQENDLLSAINACRANFMVAPEPLLATAPEASDLYAFLQSLEPGSDDDVPFSVERGIVPIPRGDAAKGEDVYGVACAYCHGAAHTGVGRLGVAVSILPEDTNLEHMALSLRLQRIVFIEKVRHGSFLGYGGDMPPFSLEQLSDEELSNLLEFLAITGE